MATEMLTKNGHRTTAVTIASVDDHELRVAARHQIKRVHRLKIHAVAWAVGAILLTIVTLGFYSLYWVFKTQDEVKEHSGIGVGGVVGLVIYIVLSPVTWFLIPSEVGKMHVQDGRTAPFTGWTGLWLLLPLVGPFVWFIKIQGALNRYWESKSAPAPPPASQPSAA